MLRGRCSCAISGRPTSSPASQSLLSPLFPLHPRNPPVTPLFPLLTQKQGGGGYPLLPLLPLLPLRPSAVNCKPVFLRPSFTTTSIDIVGAPTFPFLHASRRSQERPAAEGGRYSKFELLFSLFRFFGLFLNTKLTTDNLKLTNRNHSRTYEPFSCKSNHSVLPQLELGRAFFR
jgi:hypothetical protein